VFVERRQPGWQRLEELLKNADRRGLRSLAPEEIEELGRLYRWVTSDLAFAEGREYDPTLRQYLHRLTARAHAYVYAGSVEAGWRRVTRFLSHDFPDEVRRSRWYVLGMFSLFIIAAIFAYALIKNVPNDAYAILPDSLVRPIHERLHDSNFGFDRDFASTVSALIMTNNIRVAIMAFGGGIVPMPWLAAGLGVVPGVPTIYLVFFNGLMLGGMGAMYGNAGFGFDFWATVAPHGVIELSAIWISGAAGILLTAAVFNPGRLRRVDALRRNARRSLVLIVGAFCMLACAAIIEGFFSPQRFPPEVRMTVGALTGVALLSYFTLAGRRPLDASRAGGITHA